MAGGCGSGRICLSWLSYPVPSTTQSSPDISRRNLITHAAMQNLDSRIWKECKYCTSSTWWIWRFVTSYHEIQPS